jgi:hypothetical protein
VRRLPTWLLDLAVVWALTLPGWLPLATGRLVGTHDGYYHLYRFLELGLAVRAGDLYPRWAPEFALGFGYPVFNYYPPLALYLALPFDLLGLGLIAAFGLGQLVSMWVGTAGAYVLVRDQSGRLAGVVAGVLFGSLPYLLLDVHLRGAIAETLGLALLPWVCWSLRRAAEAPSRSHLALASVSVAALAFGHNITLLMGLPVAVAYALLSGVTRQRLARVVAAVALGLVASALYWAPALLERGLVTHEVLTTGFYDFHNHFHPLPGLIQLTPLFEYRYDYFGHFLFKAGLLQVLLAVLGAALRWRRETIFWSAVVVLGLLLQVEPSAPIWETIPLLPFVQFPWRLLTLVGMGTVVLTAGIVDAARSRPARAVTAASLLVASLSASYALLDPALLDLREDEVSPAALNRIELDRRLVGTTTSGEYTPRAARDALFDAWATSPALGQPPASVELLAIARERIDLGVASPDGGWVAIDQREFPTWRATVDGAPASIVPTFGQGLVSANLPTGARQVTFENGSTALERTAGWASALGVAMLVLVAAGPRRWRTAGPAALLLLAFAAPSAGAAGRPPDLASAAFEGGPRLLGGAVEGGGTLTLLWTADAPVERRLTVALRLLDDAGRVVARRDKPPRFGLRPTTVLQPGYVVRDLQTLPGPRDGRYRVVVGLFDDAGYVRPRGAAVRWSEQCPCAAPSPEGLGVEIGAIEGHDLLPQPAPDQRQPVAVAAGRVALLSIDMLLGEPPRPRPSLARAVERILARLPVAERPEPAGRLGGPGGVLATLEHGAALRVNASWRALADVAEDYSVTVQLLHQRQHLIAQDDEWPRRGFAPTSLWQTGQVTDDWYSLRVPGEATPGRYRLVLGLYLRRDMRRVTWSGPGAAGDWLELGHVKIPAPRPDDPPTRGALFGGSIRLVDVAVERGQVLTVRPRWFVEAPPGRDYTVFVHVVDASGRPIAQGDAPPLGGAYPTSLWEAGELIDDEYAVTGGAAGRVLIGLYRPDTGERLRAENGADAVEIAP